MGAIRRQRFKADLKQAKYYGYNEDGYVYLMIELTKTIPGKIFKVHYNSLDLYNMTFKIKKTLNKWKSILEIGYKVYDHETEIIEHIVDVYAEDLQKFLQGRIIHKFITAGVLALLYAHRWHFDYVGI